MKKLLSLLLALALILSLTGCALTTVTETLPLESTAGSTEPILSLDPDGTYDTKEEVALYIHLYGRLPGNYMTKSEAKTYGWSSGALNRVVPGKCIGGDTFSNREGLLPNAVGRTWKECDIDTLNSAVRGAKRIVFSNDGLIYYTEDHYEHFELLYGEP
ncbi:MAG: ribonuclease [Oscillospiraceae bacterium]|nr:ribonuclease [Lentisphaeria bacterium]MBP3305982.1 ribonuclease [Oscillospiraceae bacterium]